MLALLFLIGVAVVVLEVVALWQIFSKAGRPGWAALLARRATPSPRSPPAR